MPDVVHKVLPSLVCPPHGSIYIPGGAEQLTKMIKNLRFVSTTEPWWVSREGVGASG